jgi:acyl-CoA thioester hydrolase
VTFDESVAVAVRTTDLGRSSIRMAYEVRADGDVAATAETTIVYVGDGDRSTPLPDAWREAIESYEPAL